MMGVISESAYLFLGSPACIALVDMDLLPFAALIFFFALAIMRSSQSHLLVLVFQQIPWQHFLQGSASKVGIATRQPYLSRKTARPSSNFCSTCSLVFLAEA
jgi:hypothetical protein